LACREHPDQAHVGDIRHQTTTALYRILCYKLLKPSHLTAGLIALTYNHTCGNNTRPNAARVPFFRHLPECRDASYRQPRHYQHHQRLLPKFERDLKPSIRDGGFGRPQSPFESPCCQPCRCESRGHNPIPIRSVPNTGFLGRPLEIRARSAIQPQLYVIKPVPHVRLWPKSSVSDDPSQRFPCRRLFNADQVLETI
jgi:hypothetical protein